MPEPPFDLAKAHRWFAIECNNTAWALVEAETRSPDETERMLHLAHAACHHWEHAGGPLNALRALYLLTSAYAVAGLGEGAVRHAERGLAQLGDEPTSCDRASMHGSASLAHAAAGHQDAARTQHAQAARHAEQLEEREETEIFERLFPVPG